MEAKESLEAKGDGGVVNCAGHGEHAPAREIHTQVRGTHAPARALLENDRLPMNKRKQEKKVMF